MNQIQAIGIMTVLAGVSKLTPEDAEVEQMGRALAADWALASADEKRQLLEAATAGKDNFSELCTQLEEWAKEEGLLS